MNLTGELYTPEQRARRDRTRWTLVQALLAPTQFFVFLISLVLICRFLLTGQGYEAAAASVVLKTALLYLIMVTGAIWERVVFGQYLFAPAFFWEDVVSMLVIALHTAYLYYWLSSSMSATTMMWVALVAYLAYVINAAQFLIKFRHSRKTKLLTGPVGSAVQVP
ncbi:MAG: 2-vinyl bacteriochlorophyllide hydratase [Pseudomonadota bacterium]